MNARHIQYSCRILMAMLFAYLVASRSIAQRTEVNYDESKVPAYTLPEPLRLVNGAKVTNVSTWREKRRPEIQKLFETNVYGRSAGRPISMLFDVTSVASALGGKAKRKEVTVWFTGKKVGPKMDLLIYLQAGMTRPVPAFLGLNFNGNHSIHPDPGITISKRWMREGKDGYVVDHRATEGSRGSESQRWAVEKILSRGYALVTAYYGDLEPDFPEGWKQGVRSAIFQTGSDPISVSESGAIGAWAWGLSRALDYLETDRAIDAKRIAVMGHSRLGKTALWAGAQDERFAIVISNNSGEGGASLARRRFGETIQHSVSMFPYWYCEGYRKYAGRESELPVDAHLLIALMAPRPVYVASATRDLWADPRGEFLAAKEAEPVYRLFGRGGLGVDEMPQPDRTVGEFIGYHLRTGEHDVKDFDWEQYLSFADRHFK